MYLDPTEHAITSYVYMGMGKIILENGRTSSKQSGRI